LILTSAISKNEQDSNLDSEKEKLINRIVASFILFWLATKLTLSQEYHFLGGHHQELRTAVAGFIYSTPPRWDW